MRQSYSTRQPSARNITPAAAGARAAPMASLDLAGPGGPPPRLMSPLLIHWGAEPRSSLAALCSMPRRGVRAALRGRVHVVPSRESNPRSGPTVAAQCAGESTGLCAARFIRCGVMTDSVGGESCGVWAIREANTFHGHRHGDVSVEAGGRLQLFGAVMGQSRSTVAGNSSCTGSSAGVSPSGRAVSAESSAWSTAASRWTRRNPRGRGGRDWRSSAGSCVHRQAASRVDGRRIHKAPVSGDHHA